MDTVRRRVVARGRVQGVFFRDTARQRARQHGVGGWIRNRPDGAVEAVFEGDPAAIERLVAFMREGPRGAQVDELEVVDEEPEGLVQFELR